MPAISTIRRINNFGRYTSIALLLCALSYDKNKPNAQEGPLQVPLTQALFSTNFLASLKDSPQVVNQKNNFHREVRNKLLTLSATSPFFKLTLDAVDKKGYEFILYDENDLNIPQKVHDVMSEEPAGAITFKNIKKVYVNQDRLNANAAETNTSPETEFLATLANEATHIILDEVPKEDDEFGSRLTKEETKEEFKAMKDSKETTEIEKAFHRILDEEILSQVVEDIIVKQQENPDFIFQKKDLLAGGNYTTRLIEIKYGLALPVFIRVFDVDPLSPDLSKEEIDLALDRMHKHLFSKDIEEYLFVKLKDFGLLE